MDNMLTASQTRIYVPVWEKSNLTAKEAAAYSGIGEHSIRELLESSDNNFSFRVGNKWLINRKLFDKYITDTCLHNQ